MFDIEEYLHGDALTAHEYFGAHQAYVSRQNGYIFRVYAPYANRVEVIGDFNDWDGSNHAMNRLDQGVFELFIPNVKEYALYKFRITSPSGTFDKIDPYAYFFELRPGTAAKTFNLGYVWHDADYLAKRTLRYNEPLSIYEVHLGTWRVKPDGSYYSYEELIDVLIPYVEENGFTHIEIMPLNEYPYDGSWGYQPSGFFAITSRYGNPRQFMQFVDACHKRGIGVILDFVPVHFVRNSDCLAEFDGSYLFEYYNEHFRESEWGSFNFDLGRGTTISFLLSSCRFLIETYHLDGLRIDAVSNIIFQNGNSVLGINDGGLSFIKRLNHMVSSHFKSVIMIAEDSSSYPRVTRPTFEDGLGFDYKWDLGWMNDTLKYCQIDPIYRKFEHNKITFSMHYFYHERFLLPLSHDEVVHMKGSIVNKMFGSYEQKFDNVKALYLYQFTHPGKKLLFMGCELAEFDEWKENVPLNWQLLEFDRHRGMARLIRDLNFVYRSHPALYQGDYDPNGFKWIKVDNAAQSIFVYTRTTADERLVIILNFTPIYYSVYEIGVPWAGQYVEILNTDKAVYCGYDNYNGAPMTASAKPLDGQGYRLALQIAPAAGIILRHEKED